MLKIFAGEDTAVRDHQDQRSDFTIGFGNEDAYPSNLETVEEYQDRVPLGCGA